MVWAQAPSVGRLFREALAYGAFIGGLVGSVTLFQGNFFGIPLGVAIGTAYGLFFAFGGWTIGWFLVRLRMWHPVLAVLVGLYTVAAGGLASMLRPDPAVRRARPPPAGSSGKSCAARSTNTQR